MGVSVGDGRGRDGLFLAVLGGFFGCLYAATLLPGLHYFGDTTKAQFLGRLLGTTHSTGYPLYILLTAPFAHLPWGSLAVRINVFSALFAVIALLGVYGIGRALGVRPLWALLSAAFLGVSCVFWEQSVIAEVYSLNAAFLAFVLWALLKHGGAVERTGWFVGACVLYAVSFGNHLTMVTLLPTFVLATFWGNSQAIFRPRPLAWILGGIAVGMLLYSYVWLRTRENSLYIEYEITSWSEFRAYVTGRSWRGMMFSWSLSQILTERVPLFLTQLARDFGWVLALVPVGMFYCSDRRALTLLSLAALGEFIWVLNYDIPDIEVYLIPVELILAVFIGIALDKIAGAFRPGQRVRWGLSLAGAGLLWAPLLWSHVPQHEESLQFEKQMDEQIARMGQGAVVVGEVYYNPRMAYVHRLYAEGLAEEKNLHLVHQAGPQLVARYLRGEAQLVDSYSHEVLPPGYRVFVTQRSWEKPWREAGLQLRARGPDLKEVVLRGKRGRSR